MEILAGLGSLGNLFNDNKTNDNDNYTIPKCKSDRVNITKNIYDNVQNGHVRRDLQKRSKKRFRDSLEPEKTGIIHKQFNKRNVINKKKIRLDSLNDSDSDSVFSDDNTDVCSRQSNCSNASSTGLFIDKCEKFMDNRKHERNFVAKTHDDNNFLEQFKPLKFDSNGPPSSQNAVHHGSGMDTVVSRMEQERELGLKGGYSNFGETHDMSYNVVKEMTHNNMKPHFKQKGAHPLRTEHAAMQNQRRMEMFTGSLNNDRPDWNHKKEQTPLFNPATNIANIFGTPVMTNYYEGRYNPGKERRNEKPFQPIKVTTGIGLGKDGMGMFSKGAGDLYRPRVLTVDDLRPKNKPKLSYEGVIVAGQKGNKGRVMGKQVKQKQVVKIKENTPADLQKSFNPELHAPKIIGEVDPMTMGGANRGVQEHNYIGPSRHIVDKITTTELRGKFKTASKENYDHAEPRNVQLVDGLRGKTGYDTYVPIATQRGKEEKYIGPLGQSETTKSYSFDIINNIPNPNLRTIHHKPDRNGQITGNTSQHKYENFNDVPNPNLRNVHDKTDRNGTITGNTTQHKYENFNDVPNPNLRNVHDKLDRNGQITGNTTQHKYEDFNDVPNPNLRNVHDKLDRNGTITGDKNQHKYVDYADVPNPNLRNVHDKLDRNGTITGNTTQHKYEDFNDVPNPNLRNVHDKPDRNGTITGDKKQHKYENFNDVPNPNLRNVHDKLDRNGQITGDKNQHKYVDYADVPNPNLRNVHDKLDRNGQITGDKNQHKYVDYTDVPNPNLRNVHDKPDRNGTITGDKNQHKYVDYADVQNPNLRTIHNKPDRNGQITGDKNQHKYIDYTDVPNPTLRNVHDKPDRNGTITGDKNQHKYVDYTDVPNVTLRTIHNKPDRNGTITGDKNQHKYVDYTDVPNPTLRTIHNKPDRNGTITGDKNQHKYVDYTDVPNPTLRVIHNKPDRNGQITGNTTQHKYVDYTDIPNTTLREIIGETNHIGPAKHEIDAPRSRRDALNSKVNITREIVSKGRAPTTVKTNIGPTTSFTEYRFKDPVQSNYVNHPGLQNQTVEKLPFKMENVKNPTWYNNTYWDSHPEENLKKNPYINNMVHKSVVILE